LITDYIKESEGKNGVDIGIVPEEFENMIKYYRKEASEKPDMVKEWEGE